MRACSGASISARTWSSAVPSPSRSGREARRASACCSSTTRTSRSASGPSSRRIGAACSSRGRLAKDVGRAREVLQPDARRRARRAVDRLSRREGAQSDPASGVRRILEADLWEISIVTFPMLPEARIDTVKGARRLPTIRRIRMLAHAGCGADTRRRPRGHRRRASPACVRKRDAARGRRTGLAGRIREATRMIKQRGNPAYERRHSMPARPKPRRLGRPPRPEGRLRRVHDHLRGLQGDQRRAARRSSKAGSAPTC